MDSQRGILYPSLGEQQFRIVRPAPSSELAHFVEHYWIVRWQLEQHTRYVQETLPFPSVNLVLETRGSSLWGVYTRRFAAELEGAGQAVAAKFRPGGFYPFLLRPVRELTDRRLSMRESFGEAGEQLAREVLAIDDDREQLALLERFLLAQRPERNAEAERAAEIVELARSQPLLTTVEQLGAAMQLSPRSLQRLFERYVGVSPKWVLRRFRIHEAAQRLGEGAQVDLAALAHELGYCDQAHFTKDFKAQVGRAPAEYSALTQRTRASSA